MSESIVTYTAEEQKALTALANNERLFKNIHGLLQQADHKGDKAAILVESFIALENIINQTAKQAEEIRKGATERSKAPVEEAKESKSGNA